MKNIFKSLLSNAPKAFNARLNWLNDLNHMDDLSALKTSSQHLTTIFGDSSLETVLKLQHLHIISSHNAPRAVQQIQEFVKTESLRAEIAANTTLVNYEYHRQLYLAQLNVADLIFGRGDKYKLEPSNLVNLVGSILHSAKNMVKWRYFDHADAPANMWLQLHSLYKVARENNLTEAQYQNDTDDFSTKIKDLYIQINMLGKINLSGLQKPFVEIADNLLKKWLFQVETSNILEPELHHFFVDENKNAPAAKVDQDNAGDYKLYWSVKTLDQHLQTAVKAVDAGQYPLNLPVDYRPNIKHLQKTLVILQDEWSPNAQTRQRRKEPRIPTAKSVYITENIKNTCRLIKQFGVYAKPSNSTHTEHTTPGFKNAQIVMQGKTNTMLIPNNLEVWKIVDESENGFGAVADVNSNTWIALNKLVGIFVKEQTSKLHIGVIRSFQQSAMGKVHLGIELIATQPVIVDVKKLGNAAEAKVQAGAFTNSQFFGMSESEFIAIYTEKASGDGTLATLVMPRIDFVPHAFYAINLPNDRKIIKLGESKESEDDWVRVSFPT